MALIQVRGNIWYVGVQDPGLRVFDIVMKTEYGTSYNAFLLRGANKSALIETVKAGFCDEHFAKIREIMPIEQLDYIVCNHTEPDHTGSLERLLNLAPHAEVLGSATGINLIKEIINHPFPGRAVTEKDIIDLGGMTLHFLSVPMLHWPDSIYTYVPEEQALFTCDSFGCHYSDDRVFSDLINGNFTSAYKYYFDTIFMPFKQPFMQNALAKIAPLDIQFIGTGHGPVLRDHIADYISLYAQWSAPVPAKAQKEVAVVYVSAYGYTRSLAERIAAGLADAGVKPLLFDLVTDSKEQARAAIESSDAFLLGSPTLVGDALPPIWEMLLDLNPIIHKGKKAGAFGSYGWSGEAVGNLSERMTQLRLAQPLPGFKVRLKPTAEQLAAAEQFGRDFAAAL
jgi:NADH oxidase (H2O-forming)